MLGLTSKIVIKSMKPAFIAAPRLASTLVSLINSSVESLPMREAVRYTGKNIKWTADDLLRYANAHANSLYSHGLIQGDSIAVWLPDGAEKHVTLLAAAKMGLKVYDVQGSTIEEVRGFLKTSNCKVVFFAPQTETQDNLKLLRQSIPEFFNYDDTYGQAFHSKHFPHLSLFIHTGFDIEMGCLNYKGCMLPNPVSSDVDNHFSKLNDDLPLYSTIIGGKTSPLLTHKQVFEQNTWNFATKLIKKEYFEDV